MEEQKLSFFTKVHLPTELPVIGNDDQSKTMKVFAFYSGLATTCIRIMFCKNTY